MKKKIYILPALLALVLVLIIFVFSRSQNPSDEVQPLVIGAALALSGEASAWGEMSLHGIKLAVEEINDDGGIAGRPVHLAVEDTNSTAQGSLSAVSKLLSINKVAAIIGPTWLDIYHGAHKLVENTNIPMFAPDAGAEAVNENEPAHNIFITWYRTDPKAELLARHMKDQGIQSLYIFHPNDSYYIYFSDRLQKYAEENGIVVYTKSLGTDARDIRTLILDAQRKNPDAVFFVDYDEAVVQEYLKLVHTMMPATQLFGDEIMKDFVGQEDYKGIMEGIKLFHATQPDESFQRKFLARYGEEPVFGASTSYDAMHIIKEALEHGGKDLDAYIRNHKFPTVSFGEVTFDRIGAIQSDITQFDLFEVQNDTLIEIEW